MSGGRPTKLTPALLKKLEEVAGNGWTLKEVCYHIGISDDTWRSWENRESDTENHERFLVLATRVRAGMGAAIDDLAWGVLREAMDDPSVKAGDRITAATNALRLRTAHRVEVSGPDGGPIPGVAPDLSRLSASELAQLHALTRKATPEDAS